MLKNVMLGAGVALGIIGVAGVFEASSVAHAIQMIDCLELGGGEDSANLGRRFLREHPGRRIVAVYPWQKEGSVNYRYYENRWIPGYCFVHEAR